MLLSLLMFLSAVNCVYGNGVVEQSGVSGGLIVHVGCGDGRETVGFNIDDRFIVHGLDVDEAKVATARKAAVGKGVHGRISFSCYMGKRLPYADNLVNLLIVEESCKVDRKEMMRVIAPLGTLMVRQGSNWEKKTKPWPKGMGQWPHFMHGPDGNAVTNDSKVGLPARLQWWEGPLWARHHNTIQGVEAAVSANGRIFLLYDDAPTSSAGGREEWVLTARDGFNGLLLWKKTIKSIGWKEWSDRADVGRFNDPKQIHRRLVAVGDRVYVTPGLHEPVVQLDAASGKVLKRYKGTEFTSEIVLDGSTLILVLRDIPSEAGASKNSDRHGMHRITAIDVDSGNQLWLSGVYRGQADRFSASQPLKDLKVTVGHGKVMFLAEREVICLDRQNGKEVWRQPRQGLEEGNTPERGVLSKWSNFHSTLIIYNGAGYLLQPELRKSYGAGFTPAVLSAFSLETGKLLWKKDCAHMGFGTQSAMFAARKLIWVYDVLNKDGKLRPTKTRDNTQTALLGLDPMTGEQKSLIHPKGIMNAAGFHPRCYPEKATANHLWTSVGGRPLQAIDLNDGSFVNMPWLKTACRLGVLPCNGLLTILPHPCVCQPQILMNGVISVAPASEPNDNTAEEELLIKGPAWGASSKASFGAGAWTMHRGTPDRTGYGRSDISIPLKRLWMRKAGQSLTQAVSDGNHVFLSCKETGAIHAMDSESGNTIWSFLPDGVADSSPSLYKGLLLFGTNTGWVYCLDADKGTLVWRFLAAREQRRIVSFGRVSSPWPVHGSVLVMDDLVYAAAGINSYLDGGIRVFALDPATGDIKKKTIINTTGISNPSYPLAQGAIADLLCGSDGMITMRYKEIDFNGSGATAVKVPSGQYIHATRGMLDPAWFHRTGWIYGKSHPTNGDIDLRDGRHGGQLVVLDDSCSYSINVFGKWSRTGPALDILNKAETGFSLYARKLDSADRKWYVPIQLHVRAMCVTEKHLLIAGSVPGEDQDDPWAPIRGRGPAKVLVYSKADGKLLHGADLPVGPEHDGMSVSGGKVYLSLVDGTIVCLGEGE